jgi:PAS domain S-box-containing protein
MINSRFEPTFEPEKDVARLVRRIVPPPIRDIRFWGVQALVIAIAAMVWIVSTWHGLEPVGIPSYVPVSLFVIPVVYAALNFGLAGSLATATWTAVLSGPVVVLQAPSRLYVWAGISQLVIVLFVALFVGDRVEREVLARRRAERIQMALRQLFEASPAPTLLVSDDGGILEVNNAALRLFGRAEERELPATLADLVGERRASGILARRETALELEGPDGHERFVRPITASWALAEASGMQVMFFDVSEEQRRAARADAYAAWVLRGHEEERQRIAKEIHDEPVQSLIHLCRRLDLLAEEALANGNAGDVAEVRSLATSITEDLRRLSKGLRPPSLDDLGLGAAVRRLASDLEHRTATKVRLRVTGTPHRLDRDTELGLFRIAQEALNNAEKHAQASTVNLSLSFGQSDLRLRISDDGKGFDATADWTRAGSLGLIGMQERAGLLGGELRVRSSARSGTTVTVTMPLPATRHAPATARTPANGGTVPARDH